MGFHGMSVKVEFCRRDDSIFMHGMQKTISWVLELEDKHRDKTSVFFPFYITNDVNC